MPTNKPWLDDFEAQKQARINAENEKNLRVQKIQNEAMALTQKCKNKLRTPETCKACDLALKKECQRIWRKQNELWPEEEINQPAEVARTPLSSQELASKYAAESPKGNEKSQRHGQLAFGSKTSGKSPRKAA